MERITYVCGSLGGVSKLVYPSATWVLTSVPSYTETFKDVKISPSNPDKFIVAGGYGGPNNGIRVSLNQGAFYSSPTGDYLTNLPSIGTLNQISYPTDNHIFICGSESSFIFSTDGGLTFNTSSASPTDNGLPSGASSEALWFINGSTGIVATNDKIFKTTNSGGSLWTNLNAPLLKEPYIGVFLSNDEQTIVIVSPSKIYQSTDGGGTFILVKSAPANSFEHLSVFDIDNMWVVGRGGLIIKSTDQGASWQDIQPSAGVLLPQYLYSDFYTSSEGFFGGSQELLSTADSGLNSVISYIPPYRISSVDTRQINNCFPFINCVTEEIINIVGDFENLIGNIVKLEGYEGCYTIGSKNLGCEDPVLATISETFGDCIECLGFSFKLVNCTNPLDIIYSNQDLTQYVGSVVKVRYCPDCYTVSTHNTYDVDFRQLVITEEFETCLECNPPAPTPPSFELVPMIDENDYTLGACPNDYIEKWKCRLAEGLYQEVVKIRYGITVCCDIDIEEAFIKSELIDFKRRTQNNPCIVNNNCPAPTNVISTIET